MELSTLEQYYLRVNTSMNNDIFTPAMVTQATDTISSVLLNCHLLKKYKKTILST